MARGVFGVPITLETVRATGEYQEPITQRDVARYARMMMEDSGKDIEAKEFVDNLEDRSYGNRTSTKCLIYNATGTTLNFADYRNCNGHIYDTNYPLEIQNGQWGAFLHVQSSTYPADSAGAAVYRTIIPSSSSSCDWLFSWSIPLSGDNRVYTEIGEEEYFRKHWNDIHSKLEHSGGSSTATRDGYVSKTVIGEGTTVYASAIFELP